MTTKKTGRKKLPKEEKKVPITIYLSNKIVEVHGGMDNLKIAIMCFLASDLVEKFKVKNGIK